MNDQDSTGLPVNPYLQNARLGRDSWSVYLIGALLIVLIFWLGFGGVATVLSVVFFSTIGIDIQDLSTGLMNSGDSRVDKNAIFFIANIAFPFFLVGIVAVVRFLHQRPVKSLVTACESFRWKQAWIAFGLWLILAGLFSLLEYRLWPDTFSFSFDALRFGLFLLLALTLTPIQTSAEELFFRGYLLQASSLATRRPLLLSILSGLLFALPHFANPEVSAGFWLAMGYYFAFGFFLAWVSLKEAGLETALGVHAANNLYGGIVVNFEGSALPTYSLFFTTHFDPTYNLLTGIAAMGIFYLVSIRKLLGGSRF